MKISALKRIPAAKFRLPSTKFRSVKTALCLLLFFDILALLYGANTLSISTDEAKIFFTQSSFLQSITSLSVSFFGANDIALRVPFILLHFLSCLLLYALALKNTKAQKDAFFAVLLFILLPATPASALIINEASCVIFLTLLLLCAYEYELKFLFYALLFFVLFVHFSFIVLFLALVFYGFYKKDFTLLSVNLVLLGANLSLWGFQSAGKPQNHFLETLGVFAAAFSPLVFLYFFYVIYRNFHYSQKSLLWFLATTTFIFCLLLSLRQRLALEDFLPFCLIGTPLLISTLMSSYRVRLPKLRFAYNVLIQVCVIFLVLCYFTTIFNSLLYYLIKEPNQHFAYKYHLAKDLAKELEKKGIKRLNTDENLQIRLRYYGIVKGGNLYLTQSKKPSNLSVKLGKFDLYFSLKKSR